MSSEAAIVFRTFEFEDPATKKKWEVPRPNFDTERGYVTYLEKKMLAFYVRHQDVLGGGGLRIGLESTADLAANQNHYGWCRPGFLASLEDRDNTIRFLWLWFQQKDNMLTEKAMAAMYDANKGALDDLVNQALRDPNPLPRG